MINKKPFDLNELDRFSFGDEEFKKELISIFTEQLPEFIRNLNLYLEKEEWENLAREAHTAKSSVLIFGMQNTGKMLKEIQMLAEVKVTAELPQLLHEVISDMEEVLEYLRGL
jgi:HPt (histidine-containing phosphotransfer) domain-containing protein